MLCAPVPEREAARLKGLGLSDAANDEALDDAAGIAAVVARAPIAFITLVDKERQSCEAHLGLDGTEVGRATSLCNHAIRDPGRALVVEDAMLDPRFADDPFVIDRPHGRFYVGIPLLGADRLSAIGTLSVVDTIPRKLHPSELQALSALARLVERRIAGRDHVADLGQTHGQLRTTQGSLERARGQLYDAIESVDAGVAMHDATGKLILSNRTYEALASRVEMLCTSEVVAKDGGGEGSTAFAPGEHRLGDRWVRVSSRRTQEGALVSLLTDITSLKKTHDDLLVARNLAEEATRAKARFLATMSHEIRTPMNGVIGMTALLLDTPLTSEQREYVETVLRCGDALLLLINDILDFSKIEAGKLLLEESAFDPRALIEDAAGILVPAAQSKGVRLVTNLVGVRHRPKGDPTRLRQVMVNLIGNAVKFTDRGEVVIDASTDRSATGGVRLRFSVRDTGVGIPRTVIPQIFDAFSQADHSTTRKFGGTGLGLAICKNLLSLMGGTIDVESEVGVGSCFRVSIDLAGTDEGRPDRGRFEGHRALCVEANDEERRALCAELTDLGVGVQEASTAAQALDLLSATRSNPFDLCIVAQSLLGDEDEFMTHLDRFLFDRPKVVVVASASTRPTAAPRIAGRVMKPLRRRQVVDVLSACLRDSSPSRRAALERPPAPLSRSSQERPSRALVVEDNEVNARIASAMLQRLGWSVECAADGVHALEVLGNAKFDMVWMDCQMPRMDGFAATRALRSREHGAARTYVVALTASAIPADRDACLDAGMDDYIAKPVRRSDLERAIERWRALRVTEVGATVPDLHSGR